MAKGAPKSRIERVFLGWRQFALPAAVHCLFERVTTQQLTDFSGYTLVVPGGRARRRLHELLVAEGERRNVAFFPPQVMTAGQLPEELYRPRRPFADELVQQLAWTEAVKKTDRSLLARIVRNPSGTAASMSSADWLMLGRILQRQYRELAADGLSFADVAEKGVDVPTFQEADRWQALAMVQETYLRLLDELGLWDQQTARLVAVRHRECHTDRRLVLVGTVDLNRTIRQMLDQVDDRVTALIYAPHELSERFDAHGCIRDDVWNETGIDLSDDAIVVADGPADQARAVMLTLDEFDGKYAAADITLGIPDEAIIPHLQRAAYDLGLRVRWGPGRPIQETAPFQLLARTAAFLESEATAEFAELARHPDFEVFVCQHGAPSGWLSELDRYRAERLPGRLSDSSFEGDSVPAGLVAAWTTTAKLLHEFMSGRRPMSQWSSPILDLLLAVYGDQQRDPEHEQHRQILRACRALDDALMQFDYIPAPLDHPVTGAEAIRLVLQRCSSVRVPPPSDPEAIEMVGWLELTLDDAPALVVTTFNEGYVPQSMNADLFLPDTIRHRLGMEDNIRRYARDAYSLTCLANSRRELRVIVGRRTGQGDPLVPSRLLFAIDPPAMAARAQRLFRDPNHTGGTSVVCGILPQRADSQFDVPKPRALNEPLRRLRVTDFRSYLACPYRFYLQMVMRLNHIQDDLPEMDGALFGTLVHDVVQRFGTSKHRHSTDPERIQELLSTSLEELSVQRFGKEPLATVRVQIEQARLRLSKFAEVQGEWARQGWRIEHVEQPGRDAFAEIECGDHIFQLVGRIDRIDKNIQTGEYALLDYKVGDSGKSVDKAHRKNGAWIDLQLPLYRKLARLLKIDDDSRVKLGYVLLPKSVDNTKFDIADWSQEELRAADELAQHVMQQIVDEVFWPPADPPPEFSEWLSSICLDRVLD